MFAVAGARACGATRDAGGVYMEVGLSPFGSPLEDFLLDPVVFCDHKKLGLSPRQPLLVKTPAGHYDVIDWIGEQYYPNPADFLEEVRQLGLSRRLELTNELYRLLTSESRVLIVLPKAYIEPDVLAQATINNMKMIDYNWEICPKDQHYGKPSQNINTIFEQPCAGWLWQRTDIGTTPILQDRYPENRYVEREMPAFKYKAVSSCDAFLDANPEMFKPGFVASFKIGRLAVVFDREGGTHEEKIKKLEGTQLRCDVVAL